MPLSTDRPERTFETGALTAALRWASWVPVVIAAALLALRWPGLPDIVPTHFALDGTPDDYGSKWVVVVLFVLLGGLQVGLHVVSRHPRLFNYPARVTEANAQHLYREGERVVVAVLFALGILLLGAVGAVLQVAGATWLTWAALGGMAAAVVVGIPRTVLPGGRPADAARHPARAVATFPKSRLLSPKGLIRAGKGRPMSITRRSLLGLGLAVGAASVAGCGVNSASSPGSPATSTPTGFPASPSAGDAGSPSTSSGTAIGDGSQAPTGRPQPHQHPITKLAPGEVPPQFVVFSWDGCSGNDGLMRGMVERARAVGGTMTMFLSGLYLLPASKRTEYQPPRRAAGASDIAFMSDPTVRRTIVDIADAWQNGNEIGTHFCGHFGGAKGVGTWTTADWEQEIEESIKLVTHWRTNTGWTDIDPLPFDYSKELVGSRTPLLAGRDALLPAAKKHGWRYDSSGVRGKQAWPQKDSYGLYNISMISTPFRKGTIIPMDYNFYVSQAGARSAGSATQRAGWRSEHLATLRNGLQRCLATNRAPYIMGNHLNPWLGGLYLDNLTTLITEFGRTPGVQLVSFRWLCDWMDAQDPDVLASLQAS